MGVKRAVDDIGRAIEMKTVEVYINGHRMSSAHFDSVSVELKYQSHSNMLVFNCVARGETAVDVAKVLFNDSHSYHTDIRGADYIWELSMPWADEVAIDVDEGEPTTVDMSIEWLEGTKIGNR